MDPGLGSRGKGLGFRFWVLGFENREGGWSLSHGGDPSEVCGEVEGVGRKGLHGHAGAPRRARWWLQAKDPSSWGVC